MGKENLVISGFPTGEHAETFKKRAHSKNFKFWQMILKSGHILNDEIHNIPLFDNGNNNVVNKLSEGDYLVLNPHDITPGFADRSFVIYTMLHNNIAIRIKKGQFKTEEAKTLATERQEFFKKKAEMCKDIAKMMQVPEKDTLDPTKVKEEENQVMQSKVSMWDNAHDEPARWRLKMIYRLVNHFYSTDAIIKKLPKLKGIKEKKKTAVPSTSSAAFMGGEFESDMESEEEEDFEEEFNAEFKQRQNLYM